MRSQVAHTALWFYYIKPQAFGKTWFYVVKLRTSRSTCLLLKSKILKAQDQGLCLCAAKLRILLAPSCMITFWVIILCFFCIYSVKTTTSLVSRIRRILLFKIKIEDFNKQIFDLKNMHAALLLALSKISLFSVLSNISWCPF